MAAEKHSHGRAKSALGGGAKSKPKSKSKPAPKVPKATKEYIDKAVKREIQKMHISKTANGQFLVDHEFKAGADGSMFDPEQHAISPEELAAHVGENMGLAGAVSPEPPMAPPAASLPQLPSDIAAPTAPAAPVTAARPIGV